MYCTSKPRMTPRDSQVGAKPLVNSGAGSVVRLPPGATLPECQGCRCNTGHPLMHHPLPTRRLNLSQFSEMGLDADWVLDAFQDLFEALCLSPKVVLKEQAAAIQCFSVAETLYAVHLRVTGWANSSGGMGPLAPSLVRYCAGTRARPLQLQVHARPDQDGVWYCYFGVPDFVRAVRASSGRWKRHLLAGLEPQGMADA